MSGSSGMIHQDACGRGVSQARAFLKVLRHIVEPSLSRFSCKGCVRVASIGEILASEWHERLVRN
jgi:hypothetical protein